VPNKNTVVKHIIGQALTDNFHRCVNRSFLRQTDAGKFTQAEAVMTSPCDTSLTIEPSKVTNENHSEINSGRNAWPTQILVKRGAQFFDISIKSTLIKNLIEFGIKRVSRRFGNLIGGNLQFLLFRFPFPKCHGKHSA
jgi:hypothetical protein